MDNGHISGALFFDGACGMCTRSRDLLLRLNRTADPSTEPLQGDNVAERLGIPASRLLETVRWLDSSGDVYAGAEAANAALSAAIGTKLPLFVYRIPGIQFLQDAVYRWVATHRWNREALDRIRGTGSQEVAAEVLDECDFELALAHLRVPEMA
jgi:predicted DCC family thiol-disulfide oxidoreductase YuxK